MTFFLANCSQISADARCGVHTHTHTHMHTHTPHYENKNKQITNCRRISFTNDLQNASGFFRVLNLGLGFTTQSWAAWPPSARDTLGKPGDIPMGLLASAPSILPEETREPPCWAMRCNMVDRIQEWRLPPVPNCPSRHPGTPSLATQTACNARGQWTYCTPAPCCRFLELGSGARPAWVVKFTACLQQQHLKYACSTDTVELRINNSTTNSKPYFHAISPIHPQWMMLLSWHCKENLFCATDVSQASDPCTIPTVWNCIRSGIKIVVLSFFVKSTKENWISFSQWQCTRYINGKVVSFGFSENHVHERVFFSVYVHCFNNINCTAFNNSWVSVSIGDPFLNLLWIPKATDNEIQSSGPLGLHMCSGHVQGRSGACGRCTCLEPDPGYKFQW